ncbi:class IV lanthionine synthetase LanL [Rhizohabitans arisaemae]|uniref:class IV lanthionine synthetase LanL n=1 Tax=Rhizohabitans arisaemae TaxID=2720610 RepID=UPI0024B16A0E|nr:class IV lanthionine synthetase LanL [Rhizohabitans arisaemae]
MQPSHDHDSEAPLKERLDHALATFGGPELWDVRYEGFWCYATPPGHQRREQGWKIHLSATPLGAADVLEKAAEVLVRKRCAFKYARGLKELEELVSARADRGSGGKFITVYPDSDEQFRALVEELDAATRGFPGPGILSDRRLRPDSLVHYRYGGFTPRQVLNTEGSYEYVLIEPDGSYQRDKRQAWFSAPPWAPAPLPDTPAAKPDSARGRTVLLADRFAVDEAIRHSFRGGVYRALDQHTGEKVVIKQARPYVGADLTGRDARDWMRHESDMLTLFEPTGITPRPVSLFEYQGDLFLAEEELQGKSLRHWCEERVKNEPTRAIRVEDALAMARQLVELVTIIHGKGFVLRDFNPGNVVVEGDTPRLIDLEFLARPGEHVRNIATFGYTAPEQLAAERYGPAPEQAADLYSLGATLLYLVSGIDPVGPDDEELARPISMRVAGFVKASAATGAAARRLAPLIIALTDDDPAERWSLGKAAEFLAASPEDMYEVTEADGRLSPDEQRRLLTDGLAYTIATMKLDEPHLWPPIMAEGLTSDPCNVQCGAGGVIAVLARSLTAIPEGERPGGLHDGLVRAADWLDRNLPKEPRILPGLFFGRSGTAWALHETALLLGDEDLAARAAGYARRVPIRWPNPDITHGTAGAGTAMLYFHGATGDERFAERVHGCADELIARVERRTGEVRWPVSTETRSEMAGLSHHGFAHGVAGVGNFLLTAGLALEREDYVDLALTGAESLVKAVIRQGDAARWPTGEEGAEDMGLTWWCSGSAGVGTFLIRAWLHTGDARYRELCEAAAVAVRTEKWLYSPTACHGAAGGGEFLLDLTAATGDDRYRAWAEELALCVHTRNTFRDGLMVVPGDSMGNIEMGYNSGLAGVLGFLLRLRHGGRRLWMADGLELPKAGA